MFSRCVQYNTRQTPAKLAVSPAHWEVNICILLSDLHSFFIVLFGRICFLIDTVDSKYSVPIFSRLECQSLHRSIVQRIPKLVKEKVKSPRLENQNVNSLYWELKNWKKIKDFNFFFTNRSCFPKNIVEATFRQVNWMINWTI